jgi:3',5'-cyclic AMP phosphodiesterase CpdA
MRSQTLTRRQVLIGAAGATLTLALPRLGRGQPTQPAAKPFVFALISDTHLGRQGNAPAERMRRAVEEINASGAELVVHCGDLVNAGEVAANEKHYPQWMEIARGWTMPWHAVPGNHDPVDLFTKHIHTRTDYVVDSGHGFDFMLFRDAKPNPEHQGKVVAEQIDWLDRELSACAARERRAFLVSHVIYHRNAKPDVGWQIEDGRDAFTDLLKRHQKTIAAFFAGHFHSGLRGWDDTFGIHEVVLPSACWNFDGKRLRGAPGYTFDEDRPGWVLAEVAGEAMKLTYNVIGAGKTVERELAIERLSH